MNALLYELVRASVMLQTHWDETRNLWDDCVRDRMEETYIKNFRNTIQLCLKGNCGPDYVYGRGMFKFFEFIEDAAKKLSQYSGEETTFDTTGEHALSVRYADDERHKRRYTDEDDENMMVDYDEYPNR